MVLPESDWLGIARGLIGLKEIHGPQHEPKILQLAQDAGVPWVHDDETAWCAIYVGGVLKRAGIKPTGSAAARSYTNWGLNVFDQGIVRIPLGAVGVFDRPPNAWEGHVGYLVGHTSNGMLKVLSGNQKDQVSIAELPEKRLIAARWPIERRDDLRIQYQTIPLLPSSGAVSTKES